MVSADTVIKKPKKVSSTLSSKIHISGIDNLKPFQQSSLEVMMNNALAKLDKTYGNITEFKCYVKTFEEGRGRVKYSIHLYLVIPGSSFTSEQADFDFNTAISWAIKALEKEVLRAKEKYKYKTGKGTGMNKRGQLKDFLILIFLLVILGLWYQPDITKSILGNLVEFGKTITGYFVNWP